MRLNINNAFAHPWFLLILLVLIPMFFWEFRALRPALIYPTLKTVSSLNRSRFLYRLPFVLRVLSVVLITLALARPQSGRSQSKRSTDGIDIMLVADASGSMNALDFVIDGKRQNRLSVVAKAMSEFVKARTEDRLGLVVFGTYAYALAPLTLDHDVILQLIDNMKVGMAGETTAIGDALGVASNRLKDLTSKSKIIILMTDGVSDAGTLNPSEAAQAAQAIGIKIYTVGVGSEGDVPIKTPYGYQNVRIPIDEKILKEIADMTGGKYFRATDTDALFNIYHTIDSLEKTTSEVEIYNSYEEHFAWLVGAALLFLFLELLLRTTRLRRLP
jgi:Ca-activated chloride channel family protein